ncbi:MAG TPA: uridylate kinase [Isosphaeraceae bacterium]|nr:uridylate kinase [Isosphaeraceae bacterium]
MARLVVVKVGGSLLGWNLFPERLADFLSRRRSERLVLIMGGGPAADLIRDLDRCHGLGETASHALALRALDLTAYVLADLLRGVRVVRATEALDAVWREGHTPILAPSLFLELDDRTSADPLPHTWEITSDSIAARLATHLGAAELVLLKSAPLPAGTDRAEAARLGLVDAAFPASARALDRVTYVNLREIPGCEMPF